MKTETWHFITDDTLNEKNRYLFSHFEKLSGKQVVLLTPNYAPLNIFGLKQIRFCSNNNKNFIYFWSKFSFLFSKTGNALTNKKFPVRNIYNKFSHVYNFLWPLKLFIDDFLPNYERMFFFGVNMSNYGIQLDKGDVYIFDIVLLRSLNYPGILKYLKYNSYKTYGLITSWDNPYYSQLYLSFNKLFIWSDLMLSELNKVHALSLKMENCIILGPFPFHKFYMTRDLYKPNKSKYKFIAYACTFCDKEYLNYELSLIKEIALNLSNSGYQLLVRPYPSLSLDLYSELYNYKNVVPYVPENFNYVDRFGDGRESILFSDENERHLYLSKCSAYISLGTSFSIEAAIDELPIIQLYLNKKSRVTKYQRMIFERLDISDHIIAYYIDNFELATNFHELNLKINSIVNNNDYISLISKQNNCFLQIFGFDTFLKN